MVRIISSSHFKAAIILLLVLIGFLLGSLHPKVQVHINSCDVQNGTKTPRIHEMTVSCNHILFTSQRYFSDFHKQQVPYK